METKYKEFKPFDKVLVRHSKKEPWRATIFSHIQGKHDYITVGNYNSTISNIIAYDGNEYLLGKVGEPEEEVKIEEGEWIMVADGDGSFNNALQWHLSKFIRIFTKDNEERFHVAVGLSLADCLYAVKFTDFNPNDMEETKKHILYVKENKIIKHKINSDYGK